MFTNTITTKYDDGVAPIGSHTIQAPSRPGISAFVGTNTVDAAFTITLNPGLLLGLFVIASQAMRMRLGGVDAQQTHTMSGGPTGGTFTATFAAQTTPGLAWNITAAQYQTALQALSSIGPNNVICTGGPFPGTPILVTGSYALGGATMALLTFNVAGLTGGSPALAATSTTTGVASVATFNLIAGFGLDWSAEGAYFPCPVPSTTTTLFVSNVSGASGTFDLRAPTN